MRNDDHVLHYEKEGEERDENPPVELGHVGLVEQVVAGGREGVRCTREYRTVQIERQVVGCENATSCRYHRIHLLLNCVFVLLIFDIRRVRINPGSVPLTVRSLQQLVVIYATNSTA